MLNKIYLKPASEINSSMSCSVWELGFLCRHSDSRSICYGVRIMLFCITVFRFCESLKSQLHSCRRNISAARSLIKLLRVFTLVMARDYDTVFNAGFVHMSQS